MVHIGPEVVNKLQNLFVKAMSTSLLIVLFFVLQRVFDMNFQCSCKSGVQFYDVLYMIAPALILTWVLGYMESYNHRTKWDMSVRSCGCQILPKLVSVFIIWITAVLLDGDWYVCVKTNSDPKHAGLPCKEQDKLVDGEKEDKHKLKIESVTYGMMLICVFLLLWTLVKVGLICHQKWKKCTDVCCLPYYKVVYENLLEEQVSKHLDEELTKLAEDRAKALCQNYLPDIKEGGEAAEKGWSEISASDFYMKHERPDEQRQRDETPNQRRENQRERDKTPNQRRENQREGDETPNQRRENQRERDETPNQRRENQRERDKTPNQRRENQHERDETQHQRRENQRERDKTPNQRRENQHERDETQHQRREKQCERDETQHQRRENQCERDETQHQRRENQRERDETPNQSEAIPLEPLNTRPTSEHSGEEH